MRLSGHGAVKDFGGMGPQERRVEVDLSIRMCRRVRTQTVSGIVPRIGRDRSEEMNKKWYQQRVHRGCSGRQLRVMVLINSIKRESGAGEYGSSASVCSAYEYRVRKSNIARGGKRNRYCERLS